MSYSATKISNTFRKTILPLLALAIAPAVNTWAQSSGTPAISYASAKAGPNQGWEGSTTKGAAISIWAKNVGSSRGSSYVTVGGVALTSDSDYSEWGSTTNPTTAKGFQRITFWLNSRMTVGNTNGLSVTVNGVQSNILPFTIDNTGQIYFLALNGSQSNNGRFATNQGGGVGPWSNFGTAVTRMRPGDFLYMRGGNWTAIHQNGTSNYSYIGYFESGSAGCVYYQPLINGTDALRITLTSYPGEVASFEGSDVRNYSKYWTFAKLRFSNVASNQNLTLGSQWSHCVECTDHSVGLDVIGNEFVGTEHHVIQAFGDNFRIAANYVNVIPYPGGSYTADTAYAFYLCSGTDRLVSDNEMHGGAMYSIHAYDEDRESCTDTGRVLRNWTIEGNWLDASNAGAGFRSPMIIGAGNLASVDGITVKNNVLYSDGTASLTGIRIFAGNEQNIFIQSNTFYGLPSDILIDYTSLNVISNIQVSNNIFANLVPSASFPGIAGNHIYNDTGRPSILTVRTNLYDVQPKMVNATELSPIVGNPQFVSGATRDFHLTATSPAINTGLALSGVTRDYDGGFRSGALDLGAFEYLPGAAPQQVSVSVTPSLASLTGGQNQQFTATVTGSSNTGVTWTMNPVVGTLSATGFYSAPATITTTQNVVVTATSVADTTKSATATITLNAPVPVPVVAVTLTPSTASLSSSQMQQFTASVTGTTNTGVTWSMNPSLGTLSTSGLYTAPSSISTQQTVIVTATSVADASKSASATITLNPPPASVVIAVSPASASLSASQSQQFAATVTGSTNTAVTWSMNPSVGTLSSTGLYTAPSSITAQQTVVITATSAADSTKQATATVTLNPPQTNTISVTWTAVSSTQIRVSWTAPAGRPSGDWLTLTGYGAADWWFTWSATTGGATSGSFLVPMPTAVGIWQVRYHAAGRYDTLATSADLPVNVSQFSASATKAAPGAPMTISWTAPAGRPTGYADVVGLYAVGAQNGQPLAYQYTKGATSGSFAIPAPNTGTYEIRYLVGYPAAVHSAPFRQ